MRKNNYVFIAEDKEREARRVASLFEDNDEVLITDKATGKSQTRFVYNSVNNGLLVTDAASGIARKLDLDKFDIKLIAKNSPDAPKRGPSINSPEMIALEKNNKEWMFCKRCEARTDEVDLHGYCRSCSLGVEDRYFE
jgi:hypothetical protein